MSPERHKSQWRHSGGFEGLPSSAQGCEEGDRQGLLQQAVQGVSTGSESFYLLCQKTKINYIQNSSDTFTRRTSKIQVKSLFSQSDAARKHQTLALAGQFKNELHQDDLFKFHCWQVNSKLNYIRTSVSTGKSRIYNHLLSVLEGGQSLKVHMITIYPHKILRAIHKTFIYRKSRTCLKIQRSLGFTFLIFQTLWLPSLVGVMIFPVFSQWSRYLKSYILERTQNIFYSWF